MRTFLFVLAVTWLSLAQAAAAEKPNIVIILIDDMGYGDIGPFGATKQRTPNLDRMAREGMKLTSFYAAPVCSVSRAQLLTGCYGARVSVPGVYFPGQKNGLHPQEFTIAERLKEHGYATQCIGKWHVGDQPEFLPTRQGFDHYLGIPYSNDMQRKATASGQPVVPLVRDDKVVELLADTEQSRIVERYTDEAMGFIRANRDRPFFLYFPHTAVHTPIHPGEAFRGKSHNGRYGDWVEEIDWSVGRVCDTLRDLKLAEQTLVIFTSDNGPWLVKGADGGSAGPLRGGKGSTWEGGVRVPTLAWWPGKIKPQSTCDAVAGTIDLLPTAVALAGGTVPAEPVIDGRDLSPLLLGQNTQSPREAHYYFSGYHLQAVRQGPWKLAVAPQPQTMGKDTDGDAKITPRLYNLDQEIGERTNLADTHPEIVARLQALITKLNTELNSSGPSGRRPAGEVAHPKTLYLMDETPGAKTKSPANQPVAKPVALDALTPGATVESASAPQIGGMPFTISCVVESKHPDAILLAHGGSSLGYALHLKAGRVVFSVRTSSRTLTEVAATEAIDGPTAIKAALAKDGTLSLIVGDKQPVTAKAPGLIARQPQEAFCVGHDSQMPVADYTAKKPFTGSVKELKIVSP